MIFPLFFSRRLRDRFIYRRACFYYFMIFRSVLTKNEKGNEAFIFRVVIGEVFTNVKVKLLCSEVCASHK